MKYRYFTVVVLAGFAKIALLACTFLLTQDVLAHGYVSSPESRSYKCRLNKNSNCGSIRWEPQSVEGKKRFPEGGPVDGKIASGATRFTQLDEQTASRWHKTPMTAGAKQFSWTITAPHLARDFRYFITKSNWNPNQTLRRSAFESTPFCTVTYNALPAKQITHNCTVPQRTGYHVILAVWDVANTQGAFYQAIDVSFAGGVTPPAITYKDIGDINASEDLSVGDKARTRLFNSTGEITGGNVEITIGTTAQGHRNMWPAALARAINSANSNGMRAGQRNASGAITPVSGKNDIFVPTSSALTRAEVDIIKAPPPPPSVNVTGLQSAYTVGKAGDSFKLDFQVMTQSQLDIEYQLFNPQNTQVAQGTAKLNNSSTSVALTVNNAATGNYSLVVIGKLANGTTAVQRTLSFKVQLRQVKTYQYVFPNSLSSYKAGTVVLQSKNGKTYRCKPFPYSGWCKQWTASATHYEPGVGSHWSMAWEEL